MADGFVLRNRAGNEAAHRRGYDGDSGPGSPLGYTTVTRCDGIAGHAGTKALAAFIATTKRWDGIARQAGTKAYAAFTPATSAWTVFLASPNSIAVSGSE